MRSVMRRTVIPALSRNGGPRARLAAPFLLGVFSGAASAPPSCHCRADRRALAGEASGGPRAHRHQARRTAAERTGARELSHVPGTPGGGRAKTLAARVAGL